MQNKCFNRNIFGPKPTQKWAQKVLPLLISYAQKCETITLAEIAKAIGVDPPFNGIMRYIFMWIQTTLCELKGEDDWEYGEIPGITAIAIVAPEKPTRYMDGETRVDKDTSLSWKDYETNHVLPVFEYSYWNRVTEFLFQFKVNLDEVDFNKVIIDEDQMFDSESEEQEEEQEVPEGEHRYLVYAWRWSGDEGFAKIGRTRNGLKGVKDRMVTTYHPTDDPVLLGVRKCADLEKSHNTEQYILNGLQRSRPDREWVEIDDEFYEMIDKSFI